MGDGIPDAQRKHAQAFLFMWRMWTLLTIDCLFRYSITALHGDIGEWPRQKCAICPITSEEEWVLVRWTCTILLNVWTGSYCVFHTSNKTQRVKDIKFANMGAWVLTAILRAQTQLWLDLVHQCIGREIKAQDGEARLPVPSYLSWLCIFS